MADPRTIGKWVGRGDSGGARGTGDLRTSKAGDLEGVRAGAALATARLPDGVVPGAPVGGGEGHEWPLRRIRFIRDFRCALAHSIRQPHPLQQITKTRVASYKVKIR